MDRENRRELLEVIQQQKEQLTRYETRLKDVVRAYKGLAKEKETLEASLKAITQAVGEDKPAQDVAEPPAGVQDEVASDTDSVASEATSASRRPKELATLSASLAAITQEKAAAETKFLTERRRMRKEREELVAQLNTIKASEDALRSNLEETKSKLIVEKHEREQETNNNKLMLKELQKLVSEERIAKEQVSEELHQLRSRALSEESARGSRSVQEDMRVQQLQGELEAARQQLQRTEEQLRDQQATKQQLKHLQQQLTEVRQQHLEQLRSAEIAREAAELRAIEIQSQQEQRVGNLESRLQELSSTVAACERLRELDQVDIGRMRARIDALSSENSLLVRSSSTEPPKTSSEPEASLPWEMMSSSVVLQRVEEAKAVLLAREPVSRQVEAVFSLPGRNQASLREKCAQLEETVGRLEQEAARRQQPQSPANFLTAANQQVELDTLRSQLIELKVKLKSTKMEAAKLEQEIKDKNLRLEEMKQESENEKEMIRTEFKKQIGTLRFEIQQQRERSLALLEEKECEITRLRGELDSALEEAFYSPDRREKSPAAMMPPPSRKISCEIMDTNSGINSSGPPLHYIQELSRKEVELRELRAQLFQMENSLRELQLNMSTKEEKYQDQIEELEYSVARLERMTQVEGASNQMEYLKNVVLNYMLSTDLASRDHMLKAIGAVLRLSQAEVGRVKEHNRAWWWQQHQQQTRNGSATKRK